MRERKSDEELRALQKLRVQEAVIRGFHRDKIESGHESSILFAIDFLERDPYHHRSGYIKEELARWLMKPTLGEREKARILQAIWNASLGGRRRELKHYGRLAAHLNDEEFEVRVRERCQSIETSSNFELLLSYLDGSNGSASVDNDR